MFDDPDEGVTIVMDRDNARKLARLFRMAAETASPVQDTLDHLSTELGSRLNLTTNSDDTDLLDEHLDQDEEIRLLLFMGTDNVPEPIEVFIKGDS